MNWPSYTPCLGDLQVRTLNGVDPTWRQTTQVIHFLRRDRSTSYLPGVHGHDRRPPPTPPSPSIHVWLKSFPFLVDPIRPIKRWRAASHGLSLRTASPPPPPPARLFSLGGINHVQAVLRAAGILNATIILDFVYYASKHLCKNRLSCPYYEQLRRSLHISTLIINYVLISVNKSANICVIPQKFICV